MSVAQDRPVEGYILSLSKDELAQDMLQPCDPIPLTADRSPLTPSPAVA